MPHLKISEGCNWKCGYCAIPLIRGGHVSVPMEELEEEARKLAAGGVKELIVIAQDTTLLRARPLREAPPGRTAAPPLPHRRHRVDTPPLRLSHGIPRRGDRSHGIRAQDLQIPRHPVPAHLRRTALGHAPPPHQGRSLCAGRKNCGGDPRPGPCARRCWSAIPVKRKRISRNWNSSYGTYGSNASGFSPIPRRREPTRHANWRTTSRGGQTAARGTHHDAPE